MLFNFWLFLCEKKSHFSNIGSFGANWGPDVLVLWVEVSGILRWQLESNKKLHLGRRSGLVDNPFNTFRRWLDSQARSWWWEPLTAARGSSRCRHQPSPWIQLRPFWDPRTPKRRRRCHCLRVKKSLPRFSSIIWANQSASYPGSMISFCRYFCFSILSISKKASRSDPASMII